MASTRRKKRIGPRTQEGQGHALAGGDLTIPFRAPTSRDPWDEEREHEALFRQYDHLDLDRGVFDALRTASRTFTDEEVIAAGIEGGRDPWVVRRSVAAGIRPLWPVPSVRQMLAEHPEFASMTPSKAWERVHQMYSILPSQRDEFLRGLGRGLDDDDGNLDALTPPPMSMGAKVGIVAASAAALGTLAWLVLGQPGKAA